jgi:serine/threonine-protein phosphatase CPPED1
MKTLHIAILCSLLVGGGLATQAQAPPAGDSLFFIQMTDPQFGMITANGDFQQETANFEFAVATANRLRPRFVIVTGDLVNKPGDEAQIAEYERISKRLAPGIRMHHLPGNHDVGNEPSLEDLARYRKRFGPDYYSFRDGPLYGIVLNSVLLHSPQRVPEELERQNVWLAAELEKAKQSGSAHIVVFMHHPLFMQNADERDQYFNIPLMRRKPLLEVLRSAGVRWVFCGHAHRNAMAAYGALTVVTTGPVGKPLGGAQSGIRLIWLDTQGLIHRYAQFGDLPASADKPNRP